MYSLCMEHIEVYFLCSNFSIKWRFELFFGVVIGTFTLILSTSNHDRSNEEEVGMAIQQSGIPREEIFVVTKVCSY